MESYTVVVSPSVTRTRVLVSRGPDELLRACLPPPSQVRHERAMPTYPSCNATSLQLSLYVSGTR
jgi:hypothetical protein